MERVVKGLCLFLFSFTKELNMLDEDIADLNRRASVLNPKKYSTVRSNDYLYGFRYRLNA